MDELGLLIVAAAFLVLGLLSRVLDRAPLSGPMVFTALGLVLGPQVLGLVRVDPSSAALHFLAEITLILVLFADASKIDVGQLWRHHRLPLRLLFVGMPLTVLAGTGLALLFFPGMGLWQAALLAAILTPTDAALGQAVVEDERVPARIRQTLSVESGLNDGIALPIVLLFAALSAVEGSSPDGWAVSSLVQLVLGPLVGGLVGALGGFAVRRAFDRGWMTEEAEGICALAVAIGAYSGAELVGGNGFLAAFCGGLGFGNALGRRFEYVYKFEATEARLLVLLTFGAVGAVLLPEVWSHLTLPCLGFALSALTLMRMVPVALSLVGTGLKPGTVLFMGWFGPRGLASVLFVLIVVEGSDLADPGLMAAVIGTVALSILLHGVSAAPAAGAYGKWVAELEDPAEAAAVPAAPFE